MIFFFKQKTAYEITGATIDGTEVQEITIDGQVVFSAVPPRKQDVEYAYLGMSNDNIHVYQDASGNGDFDFGSSADNVASLPKADGNAVLIEPFTDNPKTGYLHDSANGDSTIREFQFDDPLLTNTTITNTYDFVSVSFGDIGSALQFSNDGLSFYVSGDRNGPGDSVEVFTLSNPFDISPSSRVSSTIVGGFDTGGGHLMNILFNPSGTKVFHGTRSDNHIAQYTLSTAFDLASKGTPTKFFPPHDDPLAVLFNNDGTKIYTYHHSPTMIDEHSLSSPYDISSVTSTVEVAPDGFHDNSVGFSSFGSNHLR